MAASLQYIGLYRAIRFRVLSRSYRGYSRDYRGGIYGLCRHYIRIMVKKMETTI